MKNSDVGSFNTIQTDGTTKFGDHFITYDIATPQTSYMLGLRHVFSGSAQNTLETFKEILDDLDAVQEALGRHAVSAKIVQALKNTMSDTQLKSYSMKYSLIIVQAFYHQLWKVGMT